MTNLQRLTLWVSLVLPSLLIVQRMSGWGGVALYAAATGVAVRYVPIAKWPRREPTARALALVTLVALVLLFALAYPAINTSTPGAGSDDDDAYNAGVRALFALRSPYMERTYLGNELHQLPGAFVLAAPFVLLGTSAIQNIFWLGAAFAAAARLAGVRVALRLSWLVLIASPTVAHQIVTGTGHAANTIYVAIGLIWLAWSRGSIAASLFWGVAMASRANFVLLWPLAAGWLLRHEGWRVALRSSCVSLGLFLSLTVPFYLHDPNGFGPLEAADRVTRFDQILPHAGATIVALSLAAAVSGALRPIRLTELLAGSAVVQAIPVVAGLVLGTLRDGWPDLAFAAYGTFFAWFALLAICGLYQSDHDRAPAALQNGGRGLTEVKGDRKLGFERGFQLSDP